MSKVIREKKRQIQQEPMIVLLNPQAINQYKRGVEVASQILEALVEAGEFS